jgi:hypothetical protein
MSLLFINPFNAKRIAPCASESINRGIACSGNFFFLRRKKSVTVCLTDFYVPEHCVCIVDSNVDLKEGKKMRISSERSYTIQTTYLSMKELVRCHVKFEEHQVVPSTNSCLMVCYGVFLLIQHFHKTDRVGHAIAVSVPKS